MFTITLYQCITSFEKIKVSFKKERKKLLTLKLLQYISFLNKCWSFFSYKENGFIHQKNVEKKYHRL